MRSDTMEHIALLFYVFAIMIPLGQLLRRIGFSRWWILLSFVPSSTLLGFGLSRTPSGREITKLQLEKLSRYLSARAA